MAFIFTCPECGAKLKTAAAIPAGRSIQCPKCNTTFKANADEDEESAAPPSKSASGGKRSLNDALSSMSRSRREEEEADRPSRKRQREEEENYDDRSEEDEEIEDRPKKKKKKKKKKQSSNAGLVIAMVLGGLVLVGGLAGVAYYFLKGSSAFDEQMLAHIPPGSKLIVGVDVAGISKSNDKLKDRITQLLNQNGDLANNPVIRASGLTMEDILGQVVVAVNSFDAQAAPTVIIKTRKPFNRDAMAKDPSLKETQLDGKTYYQVVAGKKDIQSVYMPTDSLVVLTGLTGNKLSPVLSAQGSTDESVTMVKRLRNHQAFVTVGVDNEIRKGINDGKALIGLFAPDLAPVVNIAAESKAFVAYGDVSGERMNFYLGMQCPDSTKAGEARQAMQKFVNDGMKKMIDQGKGMAGGFPGMNNREFNPNDVDVSTDGDLMVFGGSGNVDEFLQSLNMGAMAAGGGFGGPPPNMNNPNMNNPNLNPGGRGNPNQPPMPKGFGPPKDFNQPPPGFRPNQPKNPDE